MVVLLKIPGYAPVVPPTDLLRDKALSASGELNGTILPDGLDDSKTWAVSYSGATPGTWTRTGSAMKPATGPASIATVQTGTNLGEVSAIIASLAPSAPVISVLARVMDADNYLRFGPTTAGIYQLYRRQGGANTTVWTSTTPAAAGDRIGITIPDASTIEMYVNGSLIHSMAAPSTLAAITGTKWGMHGAYTSDAVSALRDFIWNPVT